MKSAGSTPTNGFAYFVSPVVNVVTTVTVYGETVVPPGFFVSTDSGRLLVPEALYGFAVNPVHIDGTLVTFSGDGFVNAGNYVAGLTTEVATAGIFGVTVVPGQLTVLPTTIVVTLADQTKAYDGTAYGGLVTFSGFVGSDTAGLITGGPIFTYTAGPDAGGTNAGTYIVNANGTTESSGNYVFDQTDTAKLPPVRTASNVPS